MADLPKRLIDFIKVGSVKTYKDNKISDMDINIFRKFIVGHAGFEVGNKQLSDESIYQLGWDTLIRAKINRGHFEITDIFSLRYTGDAQHNIALNVTQIVTRSVSTCTVLVLKYNSEIWFAHLDSCYLDEAISVLRDDLHLDSGHVGDRQIFLSRANTSAAERFYNQVTDMFPSSFNTVIIRDTDLESFENVEKKEFDSRNILLHNEIGIYLDNAGLPQLFGDVGYAYMDEEGVIVDYICLPFNGTAEIRKQVMNVCNAIG